MSYANYPNLETTNNVVGCPRNINRRVHAERVFQSNCPLGYQVDEVFPFFDNRKPYCRYLIKYCREDNTPLPGLGEGLKIMFQMLMRFVPSDCRIISKHYVDSMSAMIMYAVKCDCTASLDFEKAAVTPSPWPPIKKEEKDPFLLCEFKCIEF